MNRLNDCLTVDSFLRWFSQWKFLRSGPLTDSPMFIA